MYRKKKPKSNSRKKVFENIHVGKKDMLLRKRIKSSCGVISKNNKLMKKVGYGNDVNYQKYMLYLDKIRESYQTELNTLNEKSKRDNAIDKNQLLSKKISFSEFSNKFKINPYLLEYFDYYDIQKINRKDLKRLLRKEENNLLLKTESEFSDDSQRENKKKLRMNKTDINKYENYLNNQCNNFKNTKKINQYKQINLSGIDFDLIDKISSETTKVKKEIEHINYLKDLKKQKEKIFKKALKAMQKSEEKNVKIDVDSLVDEYTISHKNESKNVKKLNRLKSNIQKKIKKLEVQNLNKKRTLSKTMYQNTPTYFRYIPNSSKYKHISYQKENLFNKEFETDRKADMSFKKYNNKSKTNNDSISKSEQIHKISTLIKTQKNNFSNAESYFLTNNDNLLTKSNNVLDHLKEIKFVLKKDRNYTTSTINRANNNYMQTRRGKRDQKLVGRIINDSKQDIDKFREIQKKRKNKDYLEENNIFRKLKQVNGGFERDKKVNVNSVHTLFSKSLNAMCKDEKKENKNYNHMIKSSYYLKLENEIMNEKIKNMKNNIKKRQVYVNMLNYNIQRKCTKINDIIAKTGKNLEN
jgi:hypothetical protein